MASQLRRGRRVGIDYGDVRVGVAITDLEAILVSPLCTLKNDDQLISNLAKIVEENQSIYIAIGSPIHLSGEASSKSAAVAEFAKSVKDQLKTDIYLIDERLTSKSAEEQLREAGIGSKEGRGIIDQIAAVNILNQALQLESSDKGLGKPL